MTKKFGTGALILGALVLSGSTFTSACSISAVAVADAVKRGELLPSQDLLRSMTR